MSQPLACGDSGGMTANAQYKPRNESYEEAQRNPSHLDNPLPEFIPNSTQSVHVTEDNRADGGNDACETSSLNSPLSPVAATPATAAAAPAATVARPQSAADSTPPVENRTSTGPAATPFVSIYYEEQLRTKTPDWCNRNAAPFVPSWASLPYAAAAGDAEDDAAAAEDAANDAAAAGHAANDAFAAAAASLEAEDAADAAEEEDHDVFVETPPNDPLHAWSSQDDQEFLRQAHNAFSYSADLPADPSQSKPDSPGFIHNGVFFPKEETLERQWQLQQLQQTQQLEPREKKLLFTLEEKESIEKEQVTSPPAAIDIEDEKTVSPLPPVWVDNPTPSPVFNEDGSVAFAWSRRKNDEDEVEENWEEQIAQNPVPAFSSEIPISKKRQLQERNRMRTMGVSTASGMQQVQQQTQAVRHLQQPEATPPAREPQLQQEQATEKQQRGEEKWENCFGSEREQRTPEVSQKVQPVQQQEEKQGLQQALLPEEEKPQEEKEANQERADSAEDWASYSVEFRGRKVVQPCPTTLLEEEKIQTQPPPVVQEQEEEEEWRCDGNVEWTGQNTVAAVERKEPREELLQNEEEVLPMMQQKLQEIAALQLPAADEEPPWKDTNAEMKASEKREQSWTRFGMRSVAATNAAAAAGDGWAELLRAGEKKNAEETIVEQASSGDRADDRREQLQQERTARMQQQEQQDAVFAASLQQQEEAEFADRRKQHEWEELVARRKLQQELELAARRKLQQQKLQQEEAEQAAKWPLTRDYRDYEAPASPVIQITSTLFTQALPSWKREEPAAAPAAAAATVATPPRLQQASPEVRGPPVRGSRNLLKRSVRSSLSPSAPAAAAAAETSPVVAAEEKREQTPEERRKQMERLFERFDQDLGLERDVQNGLLETWGRMEERDARVGWEEKRGREELSLAVRGVKNRPHSHDGRYRDKRGGKKKEEERKEEEEKDKQEVKKKTKSEKRQEERLARFSRLIVTSNNPLSEVLPSIGQRSESVLSGDSQIRGEAEVEDVESLNLEWHRGFVVQQNFVEHIEDDTRDLYELELFTLQGRVFVHSRQPNDHLNTLRVKWAKLPNGEAVVRRSSHANSGLFSINLRIRKLLRINSTAIVAYRHPTCTKWWMMWCDDIGLIYVPDGAVKKFDNNIRCKEPLMTPMRIVQIKMQAEHFGKERKLDPRAWIIQGMGEMMEESETEGSLHDAAWPRLAQRIDDLEWLKEVDEMIHLRSPSHPTRTIRCSLDQWIRTEKQERMREYYKMRFSAIMVPFEPHRVHSSQDAWMCLMLAPIQMMERETEGRIFNYRPLDQLVTARRRSVPVGWREGDKTDYQIIKYDADSR